MGLEQLTATPHPAGNRIDLRWRYIAPFDFTGVRVVRREGTYPVVPDPDPTVPNDGVVVADVQSESLSDVGLKSETFYYYTLFPYDGDPPVYPAGQNYRVAAMATGPYDMAGQMYDLLPGIYRRYDSAGAAEAARRGPLRRFLDLPGGQLDQVYSFAKALLDACDIDTTDGALLPLLAQWIGWQTDYRLEIAGQRNELSYAPYLYQTTGLIPNLEATIKRMIGWESQTKEFVNNIFRSNRPEQLTIWLRQRSSDADSRSEPLDPTIDPLALHVAHVAYEGRPAAASDADGSLWLFFHAVRHDRWKIWYKTYQPDGGWSPSKPLTDGKQIDTHPTAALQGATLWLFWSTYSEADRQWQIRYRACTKGVWSVAQPFAGQGRDCSQPCAVADSAGGLWLFWIERLAGQLRLRYNRHDGAGWALATAATFPRDSGQDPRVEDDLFVLFHPSNQARPLWVFWARRESTGDAGQTHWRIFYRAKKSLDPGVTDDWWDTQALPPPAPTDDDREPAALARADGSVEVFWSSTRGGNWSIWRAIVQAGQQQDVWGAAEPIAEDPYSQRDPLSIAVGADTWLFYRANQSVLYQSPTYTATGTLDTRYAGCTTVDTRNLHKIALRGRFEDFQTYTYDTGPGGKRTNANWYARDTVGIYLTPDTSDQELIQRKQLIENILPAFVPIQVRVILFIQQAYGELVYTYDDKTARPQRLIGEQFFDSTIPERYTGLDDRYVDTAPGWAWLYVWSPVHAGSRTVDFRVTPVSTKWRTWHIGLKPGA